VRVRHASQRLTVMRPREHANVPAYTGQQRCRAWMPCGMGGTHRNIAGSLLARANVMTFFFLLFSGNLTFE